MFSMRVTYFGIQRITWNLTCYFNNEYWYQFPYYKFMMQFSLLSSLLFIISYQWNDIGWEKSCKYILDSNVLISWMWFWSGTSMLWMLLQWNAHQPKLQVTLKVEWNQNQLLLYYYLCKGTVYYFGFVICNCTISIQFWLFIPGEFSIWPWFRIELMLKIQIHKFAIVLHICLVVRYNVMIKLLPNYSGCKHLIPQIPIKPSSSL